MLNSRIRALHGTMDAEVTTSYCTILKYDTCIQKLISEQSTNNTAPV